MIQVKDVVKSFDGNVVLNHVSADFEDGKVNMIIGQSGSGKTVLMKSMIGLHQINEGEIIFDTSDGKQQNLAAMTEKEVRRLHREVGMLSYYNCQLIQAWSLKVIIESTGFKSCLSHLSHLQAQFFQLEK